MVIMNIIIFLFGISSSNEQCIICAICALEACLHKHIIATGYNGAPRGIEHCGEREGGCLREQLGVPSGEKHELCRALHAEQNAIIQAATLGQSVEGATIYITHQPCVICAKMIINAGIQRIVVREGYPDELAVEMLKAAGLRIVMLGETN